MWPLGQYERLVHEVKRRESKDIPVTFGLLIADYHQDRSKQYILNYLNRFNDLSDRYINFYLPGYLEDDRYSTNEKITINKKHYFFDRDIYEDFLSNLVNDFKVDYPYNPVLILLEYHNGNFNRSKRIVIELDSNGSDIRRVGEIFELIFNIAKEHVNINDISTSLKRKEFAGGFIEKIIQGIDNSFITAIYNMQNEITKYKIKNLSIE